MKRLSKSILLLTVEKKISVLPPDPSHDHNIKLLKLDRGPKDFYAFFTLNFIEKIRYLKLIPKYKLDLEMVLWNA